MHTEQRLLAVGQQHHTRLLVLAQHALRLLRGIVRQRETLGIIVLLVGIPQRQRPHLVGIELFDTIEILVEMRRQVESGQIVVARLGDDQNAILIPKLAQIGALPIVVDTQHIRIEPHLAAAQRGMPLLLERDGLDLVLGQHIAPRRAALNRQLAEIFADLHLLEMQSRLKRHLDDFRLAVRVGREIKHLGARLALRQVVVLVTGHAHDIETLHIIDTALAVTIDDIIDRAVVVLLENGDMDDVRADKQLLSHSHNAVLAVTVEDDDIVDVGTVAKELILLQPRADKALLTVDIQLLVGLDDRLDIDIGEIAHLSTAGIFGAVFVLEHLEPTDGVIGQVVDIVLRGLDLLGQILHQLVRLLGIELRDTNHANFEQTLDILAAHLTNQLRLPRVKRLVDKRHQLVFVRRCLVALLLVDTILDKNFLQRGIEIAFLQLRFLYL